MVFLASVLQASGLAYARPSQWVAPAARWHRADATFKLAGSAADSLDALLQASAKNRAPKEILCSLPCRCGLTGASPAAGAQGPRGLAHLTEMSATGEPHAPRAVGSGFLVRFYVLQYVF